VNNWTDKPDLSDRQQQRPKASETVSADAKLSCHKASIPVVGQLVGGRSVVSMHDASEVGMTSQPIGQLTV